MIAPVSEFCKAAPDGVYQGMYWAFHTVGVYCLQYSHYGIVVTHRGIL